jgi:hypothetical protein
VLLPGSGFCTLTAKLPAELALPLAVNCAEETKVVVKAVPANRTFAPLTNALPFTVIVKDPLGKEAGLTLVSTGVGFHSVTALFPMALESAALTASISTDPVFGKLAGAVYFPEEVIVPVLADPPATLFTSHVTFPFEELLTCAVNV